MAKLERGEDEQTRRQRLAKVKRGPGVFVYSGGWFDTEWVPTVKYTGGAVPMIGEDGRLSMDHAGRVMYSRAGVPVRDDRGEPVLGGVPKVRRAELETVMVRGVEFPRGVAVAVDDSSLAFKLRCLAGFEEVDEAQLAEVDEAAAKPKRGRKPKLTVDAEASQD